MCSCIHFAYIFCFALKNDEVTKKLWKNVSSIHMQNSRILGVPRVCDGNKARN